MVMKTTGHLRAIVLVTAAAGVLWGAAYFTIYQLGTLFGGMDGLLGAETADMLSGIFGAMQTAVIRPGAVPLFVVGVLFLLLRIASGCKVWVWALSPLFLLFGYIGAVIFSYVNGVLFIDLLRTLANLASNGLFDQL